MTTDIETDFMLGCMICFVAGLLIGWYVTWQIYHQEDEKRKAVANAINREKIKASPKTKWDEFIDILSDLNKADVDEYRIVYGDNLYILKPSNQPTDE